MSTDKQTHHMKHLCPQCGAPMHFQKNERRELFCPDCGLVDTYIFDAAKILSGIQYQRRREKGSIGKKILAEYQRFPVLVRKDYWRVYDLGYFAQIFYDTALKEYDYVDKTGQSNRFQTVSELIAFVDELASNKAKKSKKAKASDSVSHIGD